VGSCVPAYASKDGNPLKIRQPFLFQNSLVDSEVAALALANGRSNSIGQDVLTSTIITSSSLLLGLDSFPPRCLPI